MVRCYWSDCRTPEWEPMLRAYASYNADEGENVHPRHARYPMPIVRACPIHLGELLARESRTSGSTRQYLVVAVEQAVEAVTG
jgi:hypothetical protein